MSWSGLLRQSVHPLLKTWLRHRQRLFEKRMRWAVPHQQYWFRKILAENTQTRFAKQFGIGAQSTYSEFATRVPVMEYDEQKHFYQRAIHGEANVSTRGRVNSFSKSSGTTSDRSKYIPVTQRGMQRNHVEAAIDMIAAYYMQPNANLFSGKMVSVGGHYESLPNTAAVAGDISSLLTRSTPWYIRPYREPPAATAYLKNWEEKVEAYAARIAARPITTWAGVPSWSMLIMKRVLEQSNRESLSEVWPSFECFFHGGVSMLPYQHSFEKLFRHRVSLRETYTASEGFFAFQPDETPGMWICSDHGIFFELIPFKNYAAGNRSALPLEGVHCGIPYVLLVTTSCGLWRYVTGDVVTFESIQPYRLVVAGRTAACINLAGEELMVHTADMALKRVCDRLQCSVREYSVSPAAPDSSGRGFHRWLIEFETEPVSFTSFENLLDAELRLLNSDYDTKRNGRLLLMPEVHIASSGTFERWLKGKRKIHPQSKVPRLHNQPLLFDEMLGCI